MMSIYDIYRKIRGKTRYETNAIIIERFYENKLYESYITKGFELVIYDKCKSSSGTRFNNNSSKKP